MEINLKNLHIDVIIGLLPFEREQPQRVIVNCFLQYSYTKEQFLDYSIIRTYIKDTLIKECFGRLEDAIIHLIDGIKKLFDFIDSIDLEIIKPHIFNDAHVSVRQKVYFK